jgi:hypothetical protein
MNLPFKASLLPDVIKRTDDIYQPVLSYVQVTLRRSDVEMTQDILDVPDIDPLFQYMRCKRMAQTVKTYLLPDTRLLPGHPENFLRAPGAVNGSGNSLAFKQISAEPGITFPDVPSQNIQ